MTAPVGVTLGRLLLALDRTLATLSVAPAGLDVRVCSPALLDVDDVRLGLGRAARGSDLFLVVGVPDTDVLAWLSGLGTRVPVAIFCKEPSDDVIVRAESSGIAVVTIDPHARWERIYHLVMRVLESADADPLHASGESMRSGATGDLFDLAGEVARRTGGLVSIEDERAHVLAYSSAGDEADELRRLSILGREGPPEMMAWLRRWGVMDVLRTTTDIVTVAAHPDLGVRSRRAVAIRGPAMGSSALGEFLGVLWLQSGGDDFADDTDEVLVGAAAVAARMISRGRSRGDAHADVVRRLLGVRGEVIDADHLGAGLGIAPEAPVVVVGLAPTDGSSPPLGGAVELSALTLHASAFSPSSVTTTHGARAYVVLPQASSAATVAWAHAALAAAERQFGARLRAVVAGPATGLAAVPTLRGQVDRVLDAAEREGELIGDVATVEESQIGVLLGEIVAHLATNPELVDSRVVELAESDARTGTDFTGSLRAYLDHFGDVRSAAAALHVHPNTLRYRIRRVRALTGMDLDDPATRLVVALSLRVI
ncbi:CdaR family transcriptional regulator [Gordonia sp. OPL2]|uniref:PucR family transcriptional regulator n=1 Tax=Gordonia sp. OPL2 TaxID=2486274 RepID=UPI001654DC05|nr:helix-turn-helix domain-containing protein [Gordonia sp. OPL2]RPA10181.1 PucR family transcriptional regulator [Gordonia sp. OPL2]